jgi:nanoRNase/pAp phosphatase (c-di-AMP/oligoRNAs hydrolase)
MPGERLERLFETLAHAKEVLILTHNNPDPDAIASAVTLQYLLAEVLDVTGRLVYQGIIGRAENKALVRYLGYPLQRLTTLDLRRSVPIAVVDSQPGAGNVPLPADCSVAIVIDHHPPRETAMTAAFADIRPETGATSTMLTEYLRAADLEPSSPIATALFYGIKSDTLGLIRSTNPADAAAFCYLQSRVDMRALATIEHAQVPPEYFKSFAVALKQARVYTNVVIADLGLLDYPDLTAEMADVLLRLKGVRWVVCMGVHKDALILSVRTRNRRGAGQLVQQVIGELGMAGGHGVMAGGQLPLDGQDPVQLARQLRQRTLEYLKVPHKAPYDGLL